MAMRHSSFEAKKWVKWIALFGSGSMVKVINLGSIAKVFIIMSIGLGSMSTRKDMPMGCLVSK